MPVKKVFSKGSIKEAGKLALFLIIISIFVLFSSLVFSATPEGPSITVNSNSTKGTQGGTLVNVTGGESQNISGGYIFGINLDALQRNTRWKAYFGNVTGTLTLDDASAYTIYRWPVSVNLVGNVYATRASGTVSWGTVDCASVAEIELENQALNHTSNPADNITATFNSTNHTTFTVAGTSLNNCRSTATFQNDNPQTQTLLDDFQEIVIHDGTNIIYGTNIESDEANYQNGPADFQILIPENGLSNWASSTAYYFYVELQ